MSSDSCYLSETFSPSSLSSWASAMSLKVSAASAAATLAWCAALAASARSSFSTLSSSRREILAFRFSSRAFSVSATCWLYLFSHLAVVVYGVVKSVIFVTAKISEDVGGVTRRIVYPCTKVPWNTQFGHQYLKEAARLKRLKSIAPLVTCSCFRYRNLAAAVPGRVHLAAPNG